VPRTKLKVSGGTQTCTSDLQQQQPQPHLFKSYSLTGPSASQLSQSVRDRLLLGSQSLPKPGSSEHAALFHSHRSQQRGHRPTDGSLSDTAYSNYADLQNYCASSSPYSSWLRYSATYTSSLPARASAGKSFSIFITAHLDHYEMFQVTLLRLPFFVFIFIQKWEVDLYSNFLTRIFEYVVDCQG
jgi:neuron navigator 2